MSGPHELPKVVSFLKLQEQKRQPLGEALHGLFESQIKEPKTQSQVLNSASPAPALSFQVGAIFGSKKEVKELNKPGGGCKSSELPERSSRRKLSKIEENAAYTALLKAVKEGNDFQVQEVLQVVSSGDILQRKDSDGHTVLHLAAQVSAGESSASILSYLLHCEADLEAKNLLGETPLILAVREALDRDNGNQWLCAVSCLLEGRANPNAADDLNEETPLMEAACRGSQDMCKLLLNFKADVLLTAATGATAADFAAAAAGEDSESHQGLYKTLVHLSSVAAKRAQTSQEPAQTRATTQASPAPFATAMGFTTWSGGLSDRWHAPQSSKAEEFRSKDPKEQSQTTSNATLPDPPFPDFKPGLIFNTQHPFLDHAFHRNTYQGGEQRFPFRERPRPNPSHTDCRVQEKHFSTLGLSPEASAEEVRAAYRKLAKQYHPDKNQGSKEAAEKFREVRRAYEQISAILS